MLDYVLDHAIGDERPYLKIEVLGKPLLGLLDSGASRTILDGKGFAAIKDLDLPLNKSRITSCTVANGGTCQSIGVIELPISLRGQLYLVETLVVPELTHVLILGTDF